jgi:hypothetical protein
MASIGYMPVVSRDYNPDTHRTTGAYTDDGAEVYPVTVALTPEELAEKLAARKLTAYQDLDQQVGAKRTKFLTDAPLQDLTYANKAAEATAHKAAGYPVDLTSYPYIAAELDALLVATPTATPQSACDFICGQEAQINAIGAALEGLRRTAKEQVGIATTVAEIDDIVNGVLVTLEYI